MNTQKVILAFEQTIEEFRAMPYEEIKERIDNTDGEIAGILLQGGFILKEDSNETTSQDS